MAQISFARILPRKRLPLRRGYKKATYLISRRPLLSFLLALLILLLLIIAGSITSQKNPVVKKAAEVKPVTIYSIGKAPTLTVNAKINKTGVIKITALAGGVVQSVNVSEGQHVIQGTQLVSLATNYQGGNALALQAQLAAAQLKNTNDTYQTQKDLVQKQRDLANQQNTQAADLRNISSQSVGETQSLLDLDNSILSTIQATVSAQQQQNLDATAEKELEAQYQAAVNGLNQTLRTTNYNSSNSNPPANISDTQRDITLKQLDVQDKTLDLNKEVAQIQADIAAVNAATMVPAAPITGVVQKVYVRLGQAITPGTVLVEIAGDSGVVTAVADVPATIAVRVTNIEPSTLTINNTAYDEMPLFIPTEPTDNQLYGITYVIPDAYVGAVSDGEYIPISLPVGWPNTSAAVPFVPIDAVYQTESSSYLYVVDNGVAKAKQVTLGQVFGSYIEITTGLSKGDEVILSRNVIAGDKVKVE